MRANRQALEAVVYGHWWGGWPTACATCCNQQPCRQPQEHPRPLRLWATISYKLWLDETMNYSSAWFQGDTNQPMVQAQTAKVRRALDQVGVKAGSRVLEIGCGWGALAERRARTMARRWWA